MKIIFYIAKNGDYRDKFISFWTRGPYSHCELLFSDGVCFSSSPRDGGVRFKTFEILPTHWDTKEVLTDKEEEIKKWCETQVGKKYDWLGVVGLSLLHMPWVQDKKQWYCSEICIAALDKVGALNLPMEMNPNQLWNRL